MLIVNLKSKEKSKMKIKYNLYYVSKDKLHEVEVEEISSCPLCHCSGHPHFDGGCIVGNHEEKTGVHLFVILYCTICKKHYIAKYNGVSGRYELEYVLPSNSNPTVFDDVINNISPDFANIYNQAKQAEESGLNELVGIGYRKALEFLIKDYLIHKQNENPETIKSLYLGDCVKKLNNDRIQTLAKGAVWLGNDETHYEKRHVDYGVEHIKLFTQALIGYIISDEAYNSALEFVNSSNS